MADRHPLLAQQLQQIARDGAIDIEQLCEVVSQTYAQLEQLHAPSLAPREPRLGEFADLSSDWFWETDASHRHTFLSDGIRRIGIEPASQIGKSRWDMFDGEWTRDAAFGAHIEAVDRQEPFADLVFRLKAPGTGGYWISMSGKPHYAANGTFAGYRGTAREIGSQIEADRQLRLSVVAQTGLLEELEKTRERLELALETASMGWWDFDTRSGEQYWSPRARQIWGIGPEIEPDFDTFVAALHPEDRAKHGDLLGSPKSVGRRLYRVGLPDGEVRFVREDFRIDRRADGTIERIFATVLDLTDIEMLRTDAERAKVAAEKANIAKSRFLATMSHEIRTPMNGVLGMVELLAGTPLDARQRSYVEVASQSASDLLGIIDAILDYSRLEAGDMAIETVPFDPVEILKQTVALLAVAAENKGLTVSVAVAPDLPAPLAGDPTRFRQVLLNLIGNAVKFTERGRIDLRLDVEAPSATQAMLLVSVADTGIGIAQEALAHLFDRFNQADASIARRFGGSGLGLAISRELAQLMGGDITVRSTLGRGSVFEMRLPLVVALPEAPRISGLLGAQREAYRELDVLVAEDNEVNRIVVGELLVRMGHRCTFARDGAEAIAMARSKRFDVVLMDAQMPEIDGIEATRWIRTLPAPYNAVPIIAQTANAMRGDREKYLEAGMNDYIAKPIRSAELAAALQHATGAASKPTHTRPAASTPASAAARKGLAGFAAELRGATESS
ncbi:MAG: response regulator [Telmatospirillum sp.]|nr:response regulator [Telmatospirillum sp.]